MCKCLAVQDRNRNVSVIIRVVKISIQLLWRGGRKSWYDS